MNSRHSEIIELIHKEVKPALGCTEPIAVALAVAKAVEVLEERNAIIDRLRADFRIEVEVSANILKNGMGVGIPGTGMVGLFIAAALGAVPATFAKTPKTPPVIARPISMPMKSLAKHPTAFVADSVSCA